MNDINITKSRLTLITDALYEITSISVALRELSHVDLEEGMHESLLRGMMARTQQLCEAVSYALYCDDDSKLSKIVECRAQRAEEASHG